MTKTNFAAKSDAVMPRKRNVLRKKAPAGFAEILDEQTGFPSKGKTKLQPAATIKPPVETKAETQTEAEAKAKTKAKPRYEAASTEFHFDDLRGPTGTVIADMELRVPTQGREEPGEERIQKQTLPYARTRGTFVRIPTFSDLGRDAVDPDPVPVRAMSDDPWLPPAPNWGESRGPDPELVQTPPEEGVLAMAALVQGDGEFEVSEKLGWESLDPSVEPMVDLEDALSALEFALTVEDDAAPIDDEAANFLPMADFDTPVETPAHTPSFLSAAPTVIPEAGPTYGAEGNMFTAADPEGPVARNVEVFRTALNRAAITVDTDEGQIELAITTAGKHVMVEATTAGGFNDAIQRDLDALRSALERHDLELTELSFNEPRGGGGGGQSDQPRHAEPPSIVPAPEHGERDVGFGDDGRQTWVVPTGFRVVA
ncbi:MAG: hypothetical protein ACE37F_02625 [Nannocystaceae bacterium]|nr:hypothetical protein [bacterium]